MMQSLTTQNQEGLKSPSTLPITVASWAKNSRENIIVRLDSFKGNGTICARLWYRFDDGEFRPSPKGITVAVHHLPALARAMQTALETAKRAGLIAEGADQ
jgi:hypothetical protein